MRCEDGGSGARDKADVFGRVQARACRAGQARAGMHAMHSRLHLQGCGLQCPASPSYLTSHRSVSGPRARGSRSIGQNPKASSSKPGITFSASKHDCFRPQLLVTFDAPSRSLLELC